jgi:hypothetical protein
MNSSPLIEKPMLDGSSGNESYEMIYFRENLERISDEEFLDPDILETGGGDVSYSKSSQCSGSADRVIEESDNDMMYFIFNYRDVSFGTLINPSPRSSGSFPKSEQLANDILLFPIPPELDFSNQKTSKESVILVQKYLIENPNYPLKKKIQTNLKQQIIPKLCEGNYQLQTSTRGYTLFDAKVVPFNGKMNWLRFKTKYSGIVKYDNCEESVFRKDLNVKVSHYLPSFPNALLSRNGINGWGTLDTTTLKNLLLTFQASRLLEEAKAEIERFRVEIAAGVSAERMTEIDERKAWLIEHNSSLKVSY